MNAVLQIAYGAPERVLTLARTPRPRYAADEVLIRVRASSVNTPDWITVTGIPYVLRLRSGLRKPATAVRGTDVAGVVEAVGADVTDLRPGDQVFGSLWSGSLTPKAGAFAEYTVTRPDTLLRKPAGLSFEDAAASVMSGLTALAAMRDVGEVGEGARVLINGASGGVGTFAVQIAELLGAEVTGVCGHRNLELVRSLGAHHVIDYAEEDFTRGGRRFDVILDNVLNHPPSRTVRALTPGGRFLPNSVGDAGRLLAGLPRIARAQLLGLGSTDVRSVPIKADRASLGDLAALLESGEVKAVIDKVYPLAETPAAVAHMLSHRARGNIVITM
ncbi:NAD(P)-dependent alcohol dehydrogenase [Phytomonospora sp. NPDC050363]|uniref:NAD(P)-dependent alcohol dehydrogenase n=1 Tax=Phytomonospora sp. NPDC050363 TaxID=3155642 RepID=UPI0033D2754E